MHLRHKCLLLEQRNMVATTGVWACLTLVYSTLAFGTFWLIMTGRIPTRKADFRIWLMHDVVLVSYCITALLALGQMIGR